MVDLSREAAWAGSVDSPDFSFLVESKAAQEKVSVREARIRMVAETVLMSISIEDKNNNVVDPVD